MTEVRFFSPSHDPGIKLTYSVIAAKYSGFTGFMYGIINVQHGRSPEDILKKMKPLTKLQAGN